MTDPHEEHWTPREWQAFSDYLDRLEQQWLEEQHQLDAAFDAYMWNIMNAHKETNNG